MNQLMPLELQSTFDELEEILRLRRSDLAANPLVYFLEQLPVTSRCRQRHDLFEYSGEITLLTVRTANVLRDPSVDRITLNSAATNFHKLQAHEELLNAAISAELKTLTNSSKHQTLIELQIERSDRLKVIAILLAHVSTASQKVEEHYLKSVVFRKGAAGMQEVWSLLDKLTELTDARNEVFLRPSQDTLDNYLRQAELVKSSSDMRELFDGDVGLTRADSVTYYSELQKLEDELSVAMLINTL